MKRTDGITAIIKPCHGEAHRNPYIDNCMVCAPNWGFVLLCGNCGKQLHYNNRARLIRECAHCGFMHAALDYREMWMETKILQSELAAAQAEREACAKVADERDLNVSETIDFEHAQIERAKDKIARSIADAIHARNGAREEAK